jgi:hypothetical protein
MDYREDEALEDFMDYNDIGLPLAYLISTDVVDMSPKAEVYIDETWHLLLASLEIEDTGFTSLDEILDKEPESE